MVASPSGGGILEAALGPGGTRLLAGDAGGLALGVGLEMVNVIAVLAIAVGLYPLFRLTCGVGTGGCCPGSDGRIMHAGPSRSDVRFVGRFG